MSENDKHELWDRVEAALAVIRPNLAADGGNVKLINITEDNVVEVEMQGACKGCPMAQMTLSMGIGRVLRQEVPEVNDLRAVS